MGPSLQLLKYFNPVVIFYVLHFYKCVIISFFHFQLSTNEKAKLSFEIGIQKTGRKGQHWWGWSCRIGKTVEIFSFLLSVIKWLKVTNFIFVYILFSIKSVFILKNFSLFTIKYFTKNMLGFDSFRDIKKIIFTIFKKILNFTLGQIFLAWKWGRASIDIKDWSRCLQFRWTNLQWIGPHQHVPSHRWCLQQQISSSLGKSRNTLWEGSQSLPKTIHYYQVPIFSLSINF